MNTDSGTNTADLTAFGGVVFNPKPIVFNTVKLTGITFLTVTGITYGTLKLFNGLLQGHFTLPREMEHGFLKAGAVFGTGIAALHGYDTFKANQIVNHRVDLLNKYANAPTIQQNILSKAPPSFSYKRTAPEKMFSNLWFYSSLAWLLYPAGSGSSHTIPNLLGTTALVSASAQIGSHLAGMHMAEKKDRKQLGFIEKLALQRAQPTQAAALQSL